MRWLRRYRTWLPIIMFATSAAWGWYVIVVTATADDLHTIGVSVGGIALAIIVLGWGLSRAADRL